MGEHVPWRFMQVDGMNKEEQDAESPTSTKSRSGPGVLSLSRCAACYNHNKSSKSWLGGDGESSSSAEDSGPEVDSESEAESSLSSSSSSRGSRESLVEIMEEPDVSGGEPGGKDDDGEPKEDGETLEDQKEPTMPSQRVPLVDLSTEPNPLRLLSRPDTIISTLNLQVLPQQYDSEDFRIVQVPEENTEGSAAGGQGEVEHLQRGSPWQQRPHPTLHQHQLSHQPPHMLHLQPPTASPLTAWGQRLPPTLPTPPMIHHRLPHAPQWAPNAPQAHLEGLIPQQCWCCHTVPYWNHLRAANVTRQKVPAVFDNRF